MPFGVNSVVDLEPLVRHALTAGSDSRNAELVAASKGAVFLLDPSGVRLSEVVAVKRNYISCLYRTSIRWPVSVANVSCRVHPHRW